MDMLKKKRFLLGCWCVLAFGLAFAACNNGGEQQSETYDYIKDGTTYRLTITKSAAKAAFVPATGDAYVLRIITGTQTRTSSGNITSTYNSFSSFTLKPAQAATTFTVQMSGGKIIRITGNITLDSGNVVPGPDSSGGSGGSGGNPTGFVAVEEIAGVPTGHTIGSFTLSGTVVPSNATNKTIVWTLIGTGDQTGATMSGNTITTTGEGWVDVRATIANGWSSDRDYTEDFSIDIMRTFVAVTNIKGVPTSGTAGNPITLSGTVEPSGATNKTIVWTVADAGTTGATISGSTLTAKTAGTVTVRASVAYGLTQSSTYTQEFYINVAAAFVPVTGITGVPPSGAVPLDLSGTAVTPATATNQYIEWKVKSAGSTGAYFSGDTLHATAAGAVTVTATVPSGLSASTNYTKDFTINITSISTFVPVTDITISTPRYNKMGTSVTLSGTVVPSNATNKTIVWSIKNNGIGATMNGNTISATAEGYVEVWPTIANGLGIGEPYTSRFRLYFYSTENLSLMGTSKNGTLYEWDSVTEEDVSKATAVLNFTTATDWTMDITDENGVMSSKTGTYSTSGHSGTLSGDVSAPFYVINDVFRCSWNVGNDSYWSF
jgi:hypothetical protein